jgi:protein required for attachment to host cells
MRIRIVVASQAEVKFYDMQHIGDQLQLAGQLTDPLAHMHDRDFKSDRPGRKFDRAPLAGGRRGATAHHSTGAEQHPRKHEAIIFAQKIATELEQARQADRFDRLIVMAEPSFLGVLRQALPSALGSTVVAEVAKDLAHQPVSAVRAHLPPDAFRIGVEPG